MSKKIKEEKTKTPEEMNKENWNKYKKVSNRHVLVLETDLTYDKILKLKSICEKERRLSNELTGIMDRRLKQLKRSKRYRALLKVYKDISDKLNKENEKENPDKNIIKTLESKKKEIKEKLELERKKYKVTWDDCRKTSERLNGKYKIHSVFALTTAEDVWKGVEKVLFKDGKNLHFKNKDEIPTLRAKQINRAITIKAKEDSLEFSINGFSFGLITKTVFDNEEIDSILYYLNNKNEVELKASTEYQNKNIISTYRPCYATLVIKEIRGKLRAYVHITVEGKAKPKKYKDGTLKHSYGSGIVGCDIGTQSIAYTSNEEVGLKNLAERGRNPIVNEKREAALTLKMERSRRANNPLNYNEDGTIKKNTKIFKKKWVESNRYKKLKRKYKNVCRINAENRKFAINEEVNRMRSLGNVFVTEPKNASKLQKRAKETEKEDKITIIKDKNGNEKKIHKCKRKKRFGKSIKKRCPGYFQEQVKQKFESTGGIYIEVPKEFRASQYDHTADDYIKKELNDRIFNLNDGTTVQRDWYSSYLLHCIDLATLTIDKDKCKKEFSKQLEKQNILIEDIKKNKIKVLNSGIKVS